MRPKIKIKQGRLIEPFFKTFIEQKYPNFEFSSEETVKEKIKIFQEEWSKYNDLYFEGLEKLNLHFQRNLIEVFIVSATDRDMNSPMIIRSRYDKKEFVSVLSHELLHTLFADNKFVQEYEQETQRTRNHIYVFAILEYLFKDIFNESERLKIEKSKSSPEKNSEYYKAWQIVEAEGHLNIIKKIKNTPDNISI